jgi:CBS domain containing-hemolysin-like protein
MDAFLQDTWSSLGSVPGLVTIDSAQLAEPEMILRIAVQVLLLAASAFFSGSETALFSLSRMDLHRLRRERHPRVETLQALLDHPRRLIISILCGNELINVAAAANMTGILVALYGDARAGIASILIMVPLLLLFGEVTPKTVAVSDPVKISARLVAEPMRRWVGVITPIRAVVRAAADRVTTLIVGEEKSAENILQIDEFRSLVDQVASEGDLTAAERALIYNLLAAGTMEVVEIMVPRTRMTFVDETLSVPEVVAKARASRQARMPVYRRNPDNVIGFLHAEDLAALVQDRADLSAVELKDILRPLVVVVPTKKVDEMFDYLVARDARAALVIDEFGGVEGLVTISEVIEQVFGHAAGAVAGEELYESHEDNVFEVPGDMKLSVFDTLTKFGLEDPRMTTVGGVVLRHLDRLPEVGDEVTVDGVVLRVLEMDGLMVLRVRASRGLALGVAEEQAEPEPPEGTRP